MVTNTVRDEYAASLFRENIDLIDKLVDATARLDRANAQVAFWRALTFTNLLIVAILVAA